MNQEAKTTVLYGEPRTGYQRTKYTVTSTGLVSRSKPIFQCWDCKELLDPDDHSRWVATGRCNACFDGPAHLAAQREAATIAYDLERMAFCAEVSRRAACMPECSVWEVSWAALQYQSELLTEYAAECSIAALGSFNPQWAMYEQLTASGCFQVFAAYREEERAQRMIGFASVLCHGLPHYGVKAAAVESLFVTKASQYTQAGALLMRAVEEHAAAQGCKAILYSAPAGGRLEAVLGRRYERTNSVFCKALDE
jgi:GNAT superfamily N-acetyltransferase